MNLMLYLEPDIMENQFNKMNPFLIFLIHVDR